MDRSKWERILTCFQAFARGYLVREEVRRAREDFESIVREIDGRLTHLEWRETVVPAPHFTDTDGPFRRPGGSDHTEPSDPGGRDVRARPQDPAATASSEERGAGGALLQRTEAERDDTQIKARASLSEDCCPSRNVRGHGEGQKDSTVAEKGGGGGMESTGDTTVWSSLELDTNYGHSHRGSRQYRLAQEVPCTPEALRLHRNALTMELLWLQQAIDSRKKYLSLKNGLSVS